MITTLCLGMLFNVAMKHSYWYTPDPKISLKQSKHVNDGGVSRIINRSYKMTIHKTIH